MALHKRSTQSAEGARYDSHGQAQSGAERVAPGYSIKFRVALKGRNTGDISAFQALTSRAFIATQGRRASLRSRLPLAFTLRAFGALF